MSYKHWILIALAFFLGIGFIKVFSAPQDIPGDVKLAECRGEAHGRLNAIETFCTLVQGQLDPQKCLQTDFVKAIGVKTGNEWIGKCAGTWIGDDIRPSIPTSSPDFNVYRNVDPLGHR